jgi:hypothetical protein
VTAIERCRITRCSECCSELGGIGRLGLGRPQLIAGERLLDARKTLEVVEDGWVPSGEVPAQPRVGVQHKCQLGSRNPLGNAGDLEPLKEVEVADVEFETREESAAMVGIAHLRATLGPGQWRPQSGVATAVAG